MNLDTFEQQQNSINHEEDSNSFSSVDHEASSLKQKIAKRKAKQKRLKLIFGSLSLLVVVLLLAVGYSQYRLYVLKRDELNITNSTGQTSPAKTGEEVIKALSRHIILPENELPQIAEVTDVAKLKEKQAFFKDVKNGDIVIVYATIIILYRPSLDLIVAAGDISGVGQTQP